MIERLSLVLIVGLLAVSATSAQTIEQPAPAAKPSIEIKLSATSLMVCLGSSIPMELELTNRGAEEFKVDKFDLWKEFRYGFLGDRKMGRGGGMGSSCYDCRPDPIFVRHDETYKSSFSFDLNHDFFKDAGKYTIKVVIAGVESNDLEFELFSCQ